MKPCNHTRGGRRADGLEICIKCGEVFPDRESVAQALNSIIFIFDMIAGMAKKPEHYDEVAAEQEAFGKVLTQVQVILSYIEIREKLKPTFRVVQ